MRDRRPYVLCRLCRENAPGTADHIRHDIASHQGLSRMRQVHETLCEWAQRFNGGRGCACRLPAYEQEAARQGLCFVRNKPR